MQVYIIKGGSRAAATSKMEPFVIIVNYYHKALHLGCCSSPRSVSDNYNARQIELFHLKWFNGG